jgi:NAD(P)-dependent dehydrogenase (short-subunit alcohol dehydrogenase family)
MLKDKTAIITGGGRGIGKAIALAFARAGADVAVVSRTRLELEAVASEVRELGRRALAVVADISDAADVSRMVRDTLSEFGQIDILVNNAAITAPKPVIETSLVFLCAQAVLKPMIDRREGKIINISSGSGARGSPGNAAYSASKGGVIALTQALAGEVRELGIQVNVICPGPIKTEMLAFRPQSGSPATSLDALEPEEVAGAALFLASDYSGRMNAQIIHVRNSDRW